MAATTASAMHRNILHKRAFGAALQAVLEYLVRVLHFLHLSQPILLELRALRSRTLISSLIVRNGKQS